MARLNPDGGSTSDREGLLETASGLSRQSLDQDNDSDSDLSLDELDIIDYESKPRIRGGWSMSRKGRIKQRRGGCLRNRWLWLIIALLIAAGVILLAISKWAYTKAGPQDGLSPPWYPTPRGGTLKSWQESYASASTMVKSMSLAEKVNVTTGTGWATNLCVGNTGPANNVGFPMLCLQDGPLGVRFADHATYWPAGITTAATWNRDLMYRRGQGLGREHRSKGVNVMLGPSMGPMGRMPAGGRNWEGFGPDPVLAGVAAAETIRGIQGEGVIATAKHYILNEQEHFRQSWEWGLPNAISSNIDDRTLHELYLWPFADSIRAGVGSIMCSYNMVNNSYACDNSKLQNAILKDELGFQGFVQSDWLAQRAGVASALAGLDMTMPGDGEHWQDGKSFWGPQLTEAVLNGSVPMERINDMATRVVAAWYQLGQNNQTQWPSPPPDGEGGPNFSSWTDDKEGLIHQSTDDNSSTVVNQFVDVQGTGVDFHGRLVQQIAAEGTVLAKNEGGILPLNPKGRSNQQESDQDVKYQVGVFGEDGGPNPNGPNSCTDRACNDGTLATGWGSGAVVFPFLTTPLNAIISAFDNDMVNVVPALTNDLPKDAGIDIRKLDLCLAFVNSDAGEGYISWNGLTDRKDLYTQKGGDNLVKTVADSCPQTIVIVHAVGPVVLERWVEHPNVKAVLLANLPGEESGNALTDVLFGKVDASGRLPYTVGKSLSDYGPGGQILYKPNGLVPQQNFDEGLLTDYRHFDANSISPRYEFGFGLSYTTFSFTDLTLTTLKARSPLPSPRPDSDIQPPTYSPDIPNPGPSYFPPNFRRLKNYIYPYLEPTRSIKTSPYPYPEGYNTPQPRSQAGGGEGGNPSLYDTHLLVSVNVTNTGNRKGKQVAQLYLSFPSDTTDESTGQKIDFPVRVLRGFEKIEVEVGETKQVEIALTRRDLSYWSTGRQNWVMPQGEFGVAVGASSRDLPVEGVW